MKRRGPILVIIAVIAVLLIGLGANWLAKRPRYYDATITLKAPVTVDIFDSSTIPGGEHDTTGAENTDAKPISTLTQSQTLRLKVGQYLASSRASDDYEYTEVSFEVKDKAVSTTINPEFSEAKINADLAPQKTAIQAAIIAAYPQVRTLYKIEDGKFFAQGKWYGTKLTYVGPASQNPPDTLRIVMRRENDQWKVATTPPRIALSAPQNPSIPLTVISAVNEL